MLDSLIFYSCYFSIWNAAKLNLQQNLTLCQVENTSISQTCWKHKKLIWQSKVFCYWIKLRLKQTFQKAPLRSTRFPTLLPSNFKCICEAFCCRSRFPVRGTMDIIQDCCRNLSESNSSFKLHVSHGQNSFVCQI